LALPVLLMRPPGKNYFPDITTSWAISRWNCHPFLNKIYDVFRNSLKVKVKRQK